MAGSSFPSGDGPWAPELRPYVTLLALMISQRIEAWEFEVLFLSLYKNDPTDWSPLVFGVLDRLFGAVDEYCRDDSIREAARGLDEAGLLHAANEALRGLERLRDAEELRP